MEGLLGFLIIAIPIYLVVRHFMKKNKRNEQFAALPPDGPMKVNIQEENVPAGSFGSKRFKCNLLFDVTISQADWKAIADAGLMQHVLFSSPAPSGDMHDPNNIWLWKVEDLKRGKNAASFADQIQMHEAREKLIEALHNLRSQIDVQRGGPRKETMEI